MSRRLAIVFLFTAGAAASFPHGSFAQTCVANVPHVTGTWVTLPYQMPINPISATLLRTGKVLIVAGSENDAKNDSEGAESYRAAVWDPTGATQSSIAVQNLTYDVFCSGTAAAARWACRSSSGEPPTTLSRARTARPSSIPRRERSCSRRTWWMVGGMPRPLRSATAGSWRSPGSSLTGATTRTVEIYDLNNAGAGWSTSHGLAHVPPPLYPRMSLLPNGNVFYTGHGSGASNANWLDLRSCGRDLDLVGPDDAGTGPTAPPSSCRCCPRATRRRS